MLRGVGLKGVSFLLFVVFFLAAFFAGFFCWFFRAVGFRGFCWFVEFYAEDIREGIGGDGAAAVFA